MLVLAYIFMFLICISVTKPPSDQFYLEVAILIILWIDLSLNTVHKFISFKNFISMNSPRYYLKVIVLFLLTIDQILSLIRLENDFRFFIFLRAGNQSLIKFCHLFMIGLWDKRYKLSLKYIRISSYMYYFSL